MHVLIVGGAGYIGSHMVRCLGKAGIEVTTLDDLSSGRRDAVTHGEFVEGNLGDRALLDALFGERNFDGVMHFAAHIEVGESVVDPAKYYRNNVVNTQVLLDAMRDHGVLQFVFSSTAAIFGEPVRDRIDESHPKAPINPYGRSKLMVEEILGDYDAAYGLRSACLRYFNAAGADPAGGIGECHDPETHLVPLVLRAASGRRESISVFGSDYDTPDGTCVRDYIHVNDLCDAHLLALRSLWDGGGSAAYNLGNGSGFSVREVIDTAAGVTGRDIAVVEAERRAGDPGTLVADSTLAQAELGWRPQYADLATIVEHAWRWEQALASAER
ncbi:MAG: UDP-glucose 4-epimerase GalE [Proteobacteria bacterium]|nr:UDP-glucose 4-epimerase GalE [Pseudomonadota bacterium]